MAIKGAVLGDILGAQYEFDKPKNLDWKNVEIVSDNGVGFTDDSVMSLAIKKALDEDLDVVETMVGIGRHYPFCGYGGTFYYWITTDNHDPYGSCGNGSAMRTSYIGEFFDDFDIMQKKAAEIASVSHNHPEGIYGAVVTSTCIWMARHGASKQDIYDYVFQEYPPEKYTWSIDKDMDYLREYYSWSVMCEDSVAPAMRCFYESEDYESFMRNIYSFDCDSDTLGAIAGGVAEEYYGGFGSLEKLADKVLEEYLEQELKEILFSR